LQEDRSLLSLDELAGSWRSWLSLDADSLAFSLGIALGFSVLLDSSQEIVTALGVSDVLNADIDALFHVSVTDTLVEDNTNGRRRDVEDDASLAVDMNQYHRHLGITVDSTYPW
jgi:hypothetical protein